MKIIDLAKKFFIGGEWLVGYRKRGEEKYKVIRLEHGWIADPFLFEYHGEHYLFVEKVEKTKGEIACYKFIDDEPVFQQIVVSEPYHLSYPCVFSHSGNIYMIPESADNRSIDLYKAIQFPTRWEKMCRLETGVYYDTTYCNIDGKDYLISYSPGIHNYSLCLFDLDTEKREVRKIAEMTYKSNIARPAGSLIKEGNNLIRPAQDCSRKYGEKLLYYRVKALNQEQYDEELSYSLSVEDTGLPYQRIHTYNSDEAYECVDFFKEKFQPLRSIDIIMKHIKQRFG